MTRHHPILRLCKCYRAFPEEVIPKRKYVFMKLEALWKP